MVTILVMSAKLVTLSLVKIKVFWDKSYEAIISAHDVTSKILLCESNYIVDAVMWPRFGNFTIPMTEVIITSILWELDHKNQLFWAVLLVQVQYFRTSTRYSFEILSKCGNSYICRSYGGKTSSGAFLASSQSWIGLSQFEILFRVTLTWASSFFLFL